MITASCEPDEYTRMTRFLVQVLLFSEFSVERVVTVAKNLVSEIVECRRDGGGMVAAVSTRVCGGCERGNDEVISLFKQDGVLRDVVARCERGEGAWVVERLEMVKECLVRGAGGGFVQVAGPVGGTEDLTGVVAKVWDEEVKMYRNSRSQSQTSQTKKRKGGDAAAAVTSSPPPPSWPFPFPRTPYTASKIDPKFTRSVLVPIPGLATSFLAQIVECDVLNSPDYYAVTLLSDLLTRTEGPLYTAIRGAGYAYDASLSLALWTGYLTFDLSDASEPHKAVLAFYDILRKVGSESGFEEVCGEFEVETARASRVYKEACERSTGGAVVGAVLRGALRGFKSLEEEEAHQQLLYKVTREDLRRVYKKYFCRFFEAESRVTVMTTPPGKSAKKLVKEFASGTGSDCIKFRETKLEELDFPMPKKGKK
ncbi:hypothetical protein HK104_002628 [Borealophlyctis nickersoniae]|nr:hypothetical protein HK104_002628 [Borealophlyctis nickersoniae]